MEHIALLIFKLHGSIGLILDELARELGAICHGDLTALASTLVLEPFALEDVSIGVVHSADALSTVVLHVSLVKLTVAEQDFDHAILNLPSIEARFNDLIRGIVQQSLTLRVTFAPLSLVDATVGEFAGTSAMPQVILPMAFEDVAIRHYHLTLTVL